MRLVSKLALENDKKEAIEKIGFGWVFELKCTKLRRNLCKFLVSRFDIASCALNIGVSTVRLSPLDVHYVLGLPVSGADVDVRGTDTEHDAMYEKYYGTKTSLTTIQLSSDLIKYKGVDDGFIVRFVMFVLGTFLCPTTSITPLRELIGCFKDVNNIHSLNWAKFVFYYLVDSMRKQTQQNQYGIGGCLLFLQVSLINYKLNFK